MNHHSKICIVGTGYVGMASAIGFSQLGHQVTGYDIIPERVHGLQRGITPYREAGIDEALLAQLATGRLEFFDTLEPAVADAKYVIVAVGTPSRPNGSADLSAVESAVAALAPLVREDTVIVLRSTVPAGTTNELEERYGLKFAYAPEFLREGSALLDFNKPDRIVVGAQSDAVGNGYANLLCELDAPVIVTSYRNAELIKAFSNAFLALKISFANEVANLCDAVDADAHAVLRGVGHDRRVGTAFLAPGIGFGGPCFEKDVKSLHHIAGGHGIGRELLSATLRVNEAQPKRIVDVLEEELGGLAGAHIGIWGLAFKAGTDDVRDSLAIRIVDDLISRGAALLAFDPAITSPRPEIHCTLATSELAAIEGADALLVLTDWPQFATISPYAIAAKLRRGIVADGRNMLDPDACAAAGLRYRGVGRRPTADIRLAQAS